MNKLISSRTARAAAIASAVIALAGCDPTTSSTSESAKSETTSTTTAAHTASAGQVTGTSAPGRTGAAAAAPTATATPVQTTRAPKPATAAPTATSGKTCASSTITVTKLVGFRCATALSTVQKWVDLPDSALGHHGGAEINGIFCSTMPVAMSGPARCTSADGRKSFLVPRMPNLGQGTTCETKTIALANVVGLQCSTALAIVRKWAAMPLAALGNHGSAQIDDFWCAGTPAAQPGPSTCSTDDNTRHFQVTKMPAFRIEQPKVTVRLRASRVGTTVTYYASVDGWQFNQFDMNRDIIANAEPMGTTVYLDGNAIAGSNSGEAQCSSQGYSALKNWATKGTATLTSPGTHTIRFMAGYCGRGGVQHAESTVKVALP